MFIGKSEGLPEAGRASTAWAFRQSFYLYLILPAPFHVTKFPLDLTVAITSENEEERRDTNEMKVFATSSRWKRANFFVRHLYSGYNTPLTHALISVS